MRAIRVNDFTSPQRYALEDIDIPTPAPDEVLVDVALAAVNFADALVASGRYQVRPLLPFTPGAEGVGIIAAAGSAVAGYRAGDRVSVLGFIGDSRIGQRLVGTFAEKLVVPVENLTPIPDGVSLEQAVLFRGNAETSLYGLQRAELQRGETLLVLGAGGGAGFAAVQLGKWMGAKVIASASSAERRRIALEGGADFALDSRAPDWRARVAELTHGRGPDVVYDPVGGEATEQAFRSLAWKGRLVVIGFAAGPIPKIAANLALLKGASMVGANLLRASELEPELIATNRTLLFSLLKEGVLSVPPVWRRFPLADVPEALRLVEAGVKTGRIVIDVNPDLAGR